MHPSIVRFHEARVKFQGQRRSAARCTSAPRMRLPYFLAGCLFLVLAVIGAVLPLVPTTIFVILAAGCFARSSPKLERRILEDRRFGPAVLRWRERGAIAPAAKATAIAGMALGGLVFFLTTAPSAPLAAAAVAGLLASAFYVATRPDA